MKTYLHVGLTLMLAAPTLSAPTSERPGFLASAVTLANDKMSATFNVTNDVDGFGQLTALRAAGPGHQSVLQDGPSLAQHLWSASLLGTGTGTARLDSASAKCSSKIASQGAAGAQTLSLKWVDCVVALPGADVSSRSSNNTNATWTKHANSLCSGTCLAHNSNGPKGGHCDRLPGCGHDAGLPYCDPEAMKQRCLGATAAGCQCFTTNGYLYTSTATAPFSQYQLDSYTFGAPTPPPPPPALVSVTVDVTLTAAGLLEYSITFEANGETSLWDYSLFLPNLKTSSSTASYGPESAKQLLGIYDNSDAADADAVYFAAHDPERVVKTCNLDKQSFGCTMLALNATLPLHTYVAAFPIVITVIPQGDWWDLSQVYRKWVLPNARWTAFGPLEQRTDLPGWLENITLWFNNNWGGDPLGPNYGGDPEHVKLEMLKVNSVLNLPSHGGHLGLHWYEWDTLGYAPGSNHTKCDRTGAPCGFDTHYPDYFPARVGCSDAIEAMQAEGMRVIPYINGQLYDTLIPRWKVDNAMVAVQKFTEQTMATPSHQPALTPHLEHFDGITSAVMCPATDYWHKVMAETIIQCVNEIGFDGVYVDQVGNGETRNCADPNHNHTINGGSFWAGAFDDIMKEVRAAVKQPSMFMTEGTVEEVSGTGFDILLGLRWSGLASWHAIYGGYGYATGFAGSVRAPLDGGALGVELTKQFMVGGTMGWLTYQNYGNQFFDPANAQNVAYITKLSQARIVAKKWMVFGRATRTIAWNNTNPNDLKGACFLRDTEAEAASVVCAFAVPTAASASQFPFVLAMQPAKYGLAVPTSGSNVVVTDLVSGAVLGKYASGPVTYSGQLGALDVKLIKITAVQQHA